MKRYRYSFCALLWALISLTAFAETAPFIRVSAVYPQAGSDTGEGYLYVDPQGMQFAALSIHVFQDVNDPVLLEAIDLMPFIGNDDFKEPRMVAFPITLSEGNVYRLTYADKSGNISSGPYWAGETCYDYLSDLDVTYKTGYGTTGIDQSVEKGILNITGQTYLKGFGIHANGWVNCVLPQQRYDRFVTDVGKQNGKPYLIEFVLKVDGAEQTRTGAVDYTKRTHWDYPIAGKEQLRIDVLTTSDGNYSDHGSIGGARLYRAMEERKEQRLTWHSGKEEIKDKPFAYELDAVASSGLEPLYRITSGEQYARIDNNRLVVFDVPMKDSIVVEALQPGDREWAPAERQRSVFRLTKGRVVEAGESIELENGEMLEELIIRADSESCGQVFVKQGIAEVRKLVLKYTFRPGETNFIAFPSDQNLDKISNLNESGYFLNGMVAGKGSYFLRRYDTEGRAHSPAGDNWKPMDTPDVTGMKGYIMGIDASQGSEPREIVFTIDNVSLNFESQIRFLNLTMDLSHVEPGSEQFVYLSPVNMIGNTLKVAVTFDPEDLSVLPVNHERALQDARITYAPNGAGIRLTLPDATPAKIAIYDGRMRKLIKTIRYVSPMLMDLSDLAPGSYQMIVAYGNAVEVKSFTK